MLRKREIRILLFMRSIRSSSPNDYSCNKRITKIENKLVCRIGNEKQLPRTSSRRLPRNWRIEENLMRRSRSSETSQNWWIVYASREESHDCESIVDSKSGFAEQNSLSDAKEFYAPETDSSSGATHVPDHTWVTHVPDHTSTFLTPRTLPRCHSGLPQDTRNIVGTWGNVFERLSAREGRTSALFDDSNNLASSCFKLGPDTEVNAKRPEKEMRREPSISVPHFPSGGGMLNHTGGTYSHGGMIDHPRFPISELHLGKFLDSMEFQSWKVNSKNWSVYKESTCSSHNAMDHSIDELMTSRSIVERDDFPDYNMLDAMIASALRRLLNKYVHLRKRASVEEQRAQKYDRFLRGRQIAYMIHDHFRATGAYEAVQRTLRLIQYSFAEWRCPRFRRLMGSSSIISKRYAFRCDPGRTVQFKITGLCWASDCFGFVWRRNWSKLLADKLFMIEDVCKTSCWSVDENSKLQSLRREEGGNVHKETHIVSVMTYSCEETCKVVRDQKDDRLLPHHIRRPRLTKEGEKSRKTSGNREESSSDKRSKIPCREKNLKNPSCKFWHPLRVSKLQVWDQMHIWKKMFLQTCWGWREAQQKVKERWCERISCFIEGVSLWQQWCGCGQRRKGQSSSRTKSEGTDRQKDTLENKFRQQRQKVLLEQAGRFPWGKCTSPSCNYWHPPLCLNYKSESGCCMATNVDSDTLRLMGSTTKSRRKKCKRISGFIEGVYTIGLCISRFLSEKDCSTWKRKIGIKTRR